MTVREQVLARIAAHLRRARPPSVSTGHAHRVPAHAHSERPAPELPLHERFRVELEALGGVVHLVRGPAEAARVVVEIGRERHASRVLAWDERDIGIPGLRSDLSAERIGYDTGWLPAEEPARSERLANLERIPVGVTGALGAIAESGTIALVSGPGRSRLASLLPPVHVAVLRADRMFPSLPELLAAFPTAIHEGSNLVLITGPSRTADIEMTLTRGVHGPAEVHVVLMKVGGNGC